MTFIIKEMVIIKESILRKMEEIEETEVKEVLAKKKELSLQELLDDQAELFAQMLGEVEDRVIQKIDEKMHGDSVLEPVIEIPGNIGSWREVKKWLIRKN